MLRHFKTHPQQKVSRKIDPHTLPIIQQWINNATQYLLTQHTTPVAFKVHIARFLADGEDPEQPGRYIMAVVSLPGLYGEPRAVAHTGFFPGEVRLTPLDDTGVEFTLEYPTIEYEIKC